MASENFLLQGVWKDEALVTNSSLIDTFTKWQYQLWRKFQRSPIGAKFDRRIQVKKQGISFEWKSTRDIISLSLILVPSRKCSFSLISKIHKDMDHLHILHFKDNTVASIQTAKENEYYWETDTRTWNTHLASTQKGIHCMCIKVSGTSKWIASIPKPYNLVPQSILQMKWRR